MNRSNNNNIRRRGNRPANNQVDITKFMSTQSVRGANQPPKVNKSVTSTITFVYKPSAGATGFTPQDILINVPGNEPSGPAGSPPIYWNFIRLVKIQVWDLGSGSGSASPMASVSFTNDPRIISDYGVQGAQSAHVHVRPPLQLLSRWLPGSDAATVLFSAVTSQATANGIIYVTAELLSKPNVPS